MKIRNAKLTDIAGIAKVQVDSWRTTYRNIIPNDYLSTLSYKKSEERWAKIIPHSIVMVAEHNNGEIVGFISGGKERTGNYPDYSGELYAIYILQEYQKNSIGKKLVEALVYEFLEREISSMTVFVLEENPSRHFYEKLGGKYVDTVVDEVGGKTVNELVYGWKDIRSIIQEKNAK
ncbi:GNAT family N-acetyltransferase [Caldibacillus lycopersici]|uniref:GNAT family N-acetyltransferase n=1 Tax=Perspicuibacillus lycopersici TaxID=1325689 RepID=A0AAE3IS07_9BACI|nr:GNAT family N-acetyltransferase [Perspicuibacillus lycopersici]MCU9612379.1 GNAT family N-acetyltransferase [Perspicuibacillus lycopersici]